MSVEITTAFVQQYKANVQLLLQQRGSKLRDTVMTDSYMGKAGKAVEQIGSVSAQKRTNRHADTPLISTPHAARWVFPTDYEWADLIDNQDRLRTLISPDSPYALNGALAMGRAIDDEIIDAALGTAKTGENGTTSTVFDTNNQIAHGSVGMTVAKLRQAREILLGNEVDVENDPLYLLISEKGLTDLLATTEVTSTDYNAVKALVQGQIDTFLGFKFIHSTRLDLSTTTRSCIAYAKSGMHLGLWEDIMTKISERPDKSHATQVYVSMTIGATRLEEGKVVEIQITES